MDGVTRAKQEGISDLTFRSLLRATFNDLRVSEHRMLPLPQASILFTHADETDLYGFPWLTSTSPLGFRIFPDRYDRDRIHLRVSPAHADPTVGIYHTPL